MKFKNIIIIIIMRKILWFFKLLAILEFKETLPLTRHLHDNVHSNSMACKGLYSHILWLSMNVGLSGKDRNFSNITIQI